MQEMEQVRTAIEISHVGRTFPTAGGSFQALKDINAKIPKGILTILKGRSGSGKTTLLNIIGALDGPKGRRTICAESRWALSFRPCL